MQKEKSASASAMRMSDIIFGFIWQATWTRDSVSILSVIGASIVATSVMIIVINKNESSKENVSASDKKLTMKIEMTNASSPFAYSSESKDINYLPVSFDENIDDSIHHSNPDEESNISKE